MSHSLNTHLGSRRQNEGNGKGPSWYGILGGEMVE